MASVNVYSAEHIDELTNGAVTGAAITDEHLILTLQDGSEVDVGSIVASPPVATTSVEGVVELATDSETIAGTDTTRATTPFGVAAYGATLNTVKAITALVETALPSSYPSGISIMTLSSSAWSLNSGTGTVITYNAATDRVVQTFYGASGGTQAPTSWVREYHSSGGGGGWTVWNRVYLTADLTPGSFAQTTAFTAYPLGWSRIYYTSVNSTSWNFSGSAGEVLTYVDGTDFARQTFTKHVGGSSGVTELWLRTANSATGWSPWRIMLTANTGGWSPGAMAWGSVTITPVANTPTSASIVFPAGRFAIAPACIQVTANTGVPGSSVTEVSAASVTSSGMDIWIYRTGTTATAVWWLALG